MRRWLFFSVIALTFALSTNALQANDTLGAASPFDADADIQDLMDRVEKLEAVQVPDWVNRFTIRGDFRYRYVNVDDDRFDDRRNYNDIRARLFFGAEVNDEVDVGFQFITGDDDAGDSDQILGDSWSTKEAGLDLAYADYHPNLDDQCGYNAHFIGGKMMMPYKTIQHSQLIWDEDVRPEGVAMVFSKEYERFTFFGSLGGFYVEERAQSGDTSMFGAQAGVVLPIAESDFTFGAGYHDFGNIEGKAFLDGTGNGNSGDGTGGYDEDYDLFNAFGQYGFELTSNGIPINFFGDYVYNTAANNKRSGYSFGFDINEVIEPNDWKVGWRYKKLKEDAVVAAFTDNEFAGGGTDVKGHEFNASYVIAQHWRVGLTYFMTEAKELPPSTGSDKDYNRLQFDLNFDF